MGLLINKVEQRSKEWFDVKLGKGSGSTVSDAFDVSCTIKKATKSRDAVGTLIFKLLSEKMTGFSSGKIFVNDAMQWGIDNEGFAEEIFRNKLENSISIEPCGFAENSDFPNFGISPDVIVKDNVTGKIIEGAEIKCPESFTHLRYVSDGKIPDSHIQQVILYFVIFSDLQKMTFISYDPRNPVCEYFAAVITRNQASELIENFKSGIKVFNQRLVEISDLINKNKHEH